MTNFVIMRDIPSITNFMDGSDQPIFLAILMSREEPLQNTCSLIIAKFPSNKIYRNKQINAVL